MRIIDMHCDTLPGALVRYGKEADMLHMPEMMVDLERMQKGGVLAQFFAIFMIPKEHRQTYFRKGIAFQKSLLSQEERDRYDDAAEEVYLDKIMSDDYYIALCKQVFDANMEKHGDVIASALCAEDVIRNRAAGKMSGILTMEDGVAVEGKMEKLDYFYNIGVRALSLTWNAANCFGEANSSDATTMEKGLTAFGREAVAHMQEIGMLVDVSHLSDGGFYDVADICRKPFIATHSNCRAVCPHPRNLTDDMIRVLAEHGGVAGINFYPGFLEQDSAESRIEGMVTMAKHMRQIGGVEVIGIGSDFDGIDGKLEIAGSDQLPRLSEALSKAGFVSSEIDKIMGDNVLRVLQETL